MDAGHAVSVIAGPDPAAARADPSLDRVFPWPDRVRRVALPRTLGTVYVNWKRRFRRTPATHVPAAASAVAPPALNGRISRISRLIARLRYNLRIWEGFPDHIRTWLPPAIKAGIALGRRMRADAVFASGPPWTGVMVGHRIAKALGVPFVADFRDPWTDGSGATWCYGAEWAQRRAVRWEAAVLGDAALVCFNSSRLAAVSCSRRQLGDRAQVILNGSDMPRQTVPAQIPASRPLAFRHFGSMYAGRTVWPLLDALVQLIARGTIRSEDVTVDLIGDHELREAELERLTSTPVPVRFTAHVPFADASARMQEPSVLLSVQSEQHANLIPTKLFDYLCTGNPVLVLSPEASASWDIARTFARCSRLDLQPTEHNLTVLTTMFAAWGAGALHRESSAQDTDAFSKPQLGRVFTRLIEDIVAAHRS
jgi:hypothetical protein